MSWTPTDSSLFFSKHDQNDLRFGDFALHGPSEVLTDGPADLAIWGYADDEGIALNKGRVGASQGPKSVRTLFYKMTPHVLFPRQGKILDFGDVSKKIPLAERHQAGLVLAEKMTLQKTPWISIGGGHDYGYADGAGFLRAALQGREGAPSPSVKKPVVINFDAHLDVRPSENGLNSGTPFYRLLSEFGSDFHFFEVGLQPQCNSRAHWDWALAKGAQLLPLSLIEEEGLLKMLTRVLAPFEGHALWVSFDIDCLRSSEAPGCSQSWTTGLETKEVLKVLNWFTHHFDWSGFSIYEVSPPLDFDNLTSKAAALLMHQFFSLSMVRRGAKMLGANP